MQAANCDNAVPAEIESTQDNPADHTMAPAMPAESLTLHNRETGPSESALSCTAQVHAGCVVGNGPTRICQAVDVLAQPRKSTESTSHTELHDKGSPTETSVTDELACASQIPQLLTKQATAIAAALAALHTVQAETHTLAEAGTLQGIFLFGFFRLPVLKTHRKARCIAHN